MRCSDDIAAVHQPGACPAARRAGSVLDRKVRQAARDIVALVAERQRGVARRGLKRPDVLHRERQKLFRASEASAILRVWEQTLELPRLVWQPLVTQAVRQESFRASRQPAPRLRDGLPGELP